MKLERLTSAVLFVAVTAGFVSKLLFAQPQQTNATVTTLDAILFADQFPGADAGAKIAACITALPSTGGVCDARGFTGLQTLSTVTYNKANVEVIFNPSASFLVTGQQTITANYVHLHGDGYGGTIWVDYLGGSSPAPNLLVISGSASNWMVDGFNFTCGGLGTLCGSAGNHIAVLGTSSSGVSDGIIRNNRIFGAQGAGQDYNNNSMGAYSACGIYLHNTGSIYIEQNYIFGNGRGVCSDNSSASITPNNVMHLEYNTQISSAHSDGFTIFGGGQNGLSVVGNHFENNGGWAMNLAGGVNGSIISGNYAEANASGFFTCSSSCYSSGTKIDGNFISISNTAPVVSFTNGASLSQGISVSNNSITYTGTGLTIPDGIIYNGSAGTFKDNTASINCGNTNPNPPCASGPSTLTNLVRLTSTSSKNIAMGNQLGTGSGSGAVVTNPLADQTFSPTLNTNGMYQQGFAPSCKSGSCLFFQFDNAANSELGVGGGNNGSELGLWVSNFTLGSTVGNIQVGDSNAVGQLSLNPNGGNVGVGTASPQATLDTAGQDRRKPVTFSALTACGGTIEGETAAVTDSTTNTWGSTITGGGTNHVLGYCNGTHWTVAAK